MAYIRAVGQPFVLCPKFSPPTCRSLSLPVSCSLGVQKVEMGRDLKTKYDEWEWWNGSVKEGSYICNDLLHVRNEWLREGIVPISNVRGVNKFISIARKVGDGVMELKAAPQFYSDLKDCMSELRCPYRLEAIGVATLRANGK